jgi:MOSC domain-containing protein YiiM
MQNVSLPSAELPQLTRSVAACLASILEVDPVVVPTPPAEHPEPWTVWRNWLGERGMGLVPVSDPSRFEWPGPWLALLRSDTDGGQVGAVAFGSPPGLAWNPLDDAATFDDVEAGYLIAPADVALWAPVVTTTSRTSGRVEALALAEEAEAPMVVVEQAVARAGRGLEGDRYFDGHGTFSNAHARGHDLTLIEAEVLDELKLPSGRLASEEARRNVVTRGIDLNALVGKRFVIGEVECVGQRLCEPCAHLERLTGPGTLRGLIHRGGLRADVLTDGTLRVGDEVRVA